MVFITPASSRVSDSLLRAGCLCLLLAVAQPLLAAPFGIANVSVRLHEQVYLLSADIHYDFSAEALEALHNGVPLTIRIDIEIEKTREWLWNSTLASLQQGFSLQYHALSHQYVLQNLNSGALYAFHNREAAFAALGQLRDLPLLDRQLLLEQQPYLIKLRARLDIESLPSPLRPIAYITPAWRLKSDWYRWSFTP